MSTNHLCKQKLYNQFTLSKHLDHRRQPNQTTQSSRLISYISLPKVEPSRPSTRKNTYSTTSRLGSSNLIECQSSARLMMQNYSLTSSNPYVSSTSCCIINIKTESLLFQKNDDEIREIASLTKIMTCFLSLKLCKELKISLESQVLVSEKAVKSIGTSAGLIEGSRLTIRSLLYGLMLPSGNDAAIVLAEFFGNFICISTKPMQVFVREMNRTARDLKLTCTNFGNPHGLSYKGNLSCARDIARLTITALKDPIFREIIKSQVYLADFRLKNADKTQKTWNNTNKLLWEGFEGVKTGNTSSAGPCLCALSGKFVYVMLNCRTSETRWVEAKKLKKWVECVYYEDL